MDAMFDPAYMILALISSAIGTGAFMYGRSQTDPKALLIGFLLFGVSYFVTDPWKLGAATGVLTVLLFSDQLQTWMYPPPKGTIQSIHSVGRRKL